MPSPGSPFTNPFSQKLHNFSDRLARVPLPYRARPAVWIAFGTLPAFFATLVLPFPVVIIVVLLSVPWIFLLFDGDFQRRIFEYNRTEITLFIALPFYAYALFWGTLVVSLGHPELIGRAVGSVLFLVLIAIWPVFRANKHLDRKERTIPFDDVYLAGGFLVATQQIVYLLNQLD